MYASIKPSRYGKRILMEMMRPKVFLAFGVVRFERVAESSTAQNIGVPSIRSPTFEILISNDKDSRMHPSQRIY